MGAVKNSGVFKGVAVNGQIVKGLVKNGVVFWRQQSYDVSTQAIIDSANSKGYPLPVNLTPLDNFIRNLKTISSGNFWEKRDSIFISSIIGNSVNYHGFRKLNLKNPSGQERVFYGGLSLNSYGGIQGNGTNAYTDHVTLVNEYINFKQNDAGLIVVKSLDASGIIVAGLNSNSLSIILRGNLSTNVRLNTLTVTPSFDSGGFGTIGSSKNSISSQVCYNKAISANHTVTSLSVPANAVIQEFRNSANTAVYYAIDSLITLIGASYTQEEFLQFRTYFNQYLVESGFSSIA
ncbi:hypothetical protein [Chryseobacterium sp. FH1]|uniref:hypothetical protein n=1 Tax=Chryseobacterium sp. FH1 TaxID=1233951 RepID=UPI0004E31B3D|nr:hypothetical protein [Chryseobacterium sp. FH1]KFC19362.1 hypothetical protein IO90_08645 [Chryseobacterium sp. FH1]